MKVATKEQAFREANKIIPCDYLYSDEASARAGYPIYLSIEGDNWISDLGTRLEVNVGSKSYNIHYCGTLAEIASEYFAKCKEVILE